MSFETQSQTAPYETFDSATRRVVTVLSSAAVAEQFRSPQHQLLDMQWAAQQAERAEAGKWEDL